MTSAARTAVPLRFKARASTRCQLTQASGRTVASVKAATTHGDIGCSVWTQSCVTGNA